MKDPHHAYLQAMEIAKAQAEMDAAMARRNAAAKRFSDSVRSLMKKHRITQPTLLAELPGWKKARLDNFLHLHYILSPAETTSLLRAVQKVCSK